MHPILFEVPRPTSWGTALIITILVALGLGLELREQRRTEMPVDTIRLTVIALFSALLGVIFSLGLRRWGPVPVRAWGTMLMLGFTAGMLWAIRDVRDDNQFDTDYIIDVTLAILVGAIVGARLLSVALNWGHYAGTPSELLRVWAGGLSFHGGLAGGFLGGALLTVRRGLSVPRAMDLMAPPIALGYAITRIGCFLNGCCYGAPTESVFAVTFNKLANTGVPGIDLHPTQLYAAAASVLIFGILLAVRQRVKVNGHLFGWYVMIYSGARFIIEQFRRNASAEVFRPLAPLTIAQTGSIAIIIIVAALMAVSHARAKRQ